MKILAIDCATNSGIAMVDFGENGEVDEISTAHIKLTTNPDIKSMIAAVPEGVPDYIILERPFLLTPRTPKEEGEKGKTKEPAFMADDQEEIFRRSLYGYERQLETLILWRAAVYERFGIVCKRYDKRRINHKAKGRVVWPATWQAPIGRMANASPRENKKRVARRFVGSLLGYAFPSHDVNDAVCMAWYQYQICKPLGLAPTTERQRRVIDAMRDSGALLPTRKQLDLFR